MLSDGAVEWVKFGLGVVCTAVALVAAYASEKMGREEEEMGADVKYPDVSVRLVGEDGNAFALLGRVSKALKRGGHGDVVDEFMDEATAGDYNDLLNTVMRWVDVDPPEGEDDEDD